MRQRGSSRQGYGSWGASWAGKDWATLAYSPNGKTLASGDWNKTIKLRDLGKKTPSQPADG